MPARSLTALVGASGSGKTTLPRLLLRHFAPQQGNVSIGGIDLGDIPADRLLDVVSVVFQDVQLFDDTVMNNIRTACPDAADADVLAAKGSASPSPAPCSRTPPSSSWTNRRRRGTAKAKFRCNASSTPWSAIRRCWSSPTGYPPSADLMAADGCYRRMRGR